MVVKRCPFCQGNSKVSSRRTSGRLTKTARISSQVRCNTCHARGPLFDTEERAIRAWNSIAVVGVNR